ncbi:RNA polymerase sigma factor [Aquisphaera insulae]|uniref:RNA polymerase sigma factor n=1 Tax=Aquisphaera insulae TaxID=2712864 RepID=UPI0013E9E144|nr:sigma-70 family RNA polymerase sigma factor [Aquisphaera insulae]
MTVAPMDFQAGGGSRDIRSLLNRIRLGDEDAARELLARYESKVRMVVRRKLPRLLRLRFDSMDFLQSVWKSFFRRIRAGENDIVGEQNLIAFLAWAARNKVVDEYRHAATLKQDIRRERNVDQVGLDDPALVDPETPSQTARAKETLEKLRDHLPVQRREVIELKAAGYTCAEIGKRLGMSERTVQRILEELRHRLRDEG